MARAADAQQSMQTLAAPAAAMKQFEQLRIGANATLVRRVGGETARLLVGARGTLDDNEVIPAGDYPLAGVALGGDLALTGVHVTRTTEDDGERIIIGTLGSSPEKVELLILWHRPRGQEREMRLSWQQILDRHRVYL